MADTSRYRRSLWGMQLGGLGLGVSFLYAPVGLALGLLGLRLVYLGSFKSGDAVARSLCQATGIMYAASVYLGSHDWPLAVAAAAAPMMVVGSDGAIRWLGFRAGLLTPLAGALSLAVLLLGWPPTLWWLAVAPIPLYLAWSSKRFLAGLATMEKQNRRSWALEEGVQVGDFELPIRFSDETFRLSDHQGTRLLVQFTRGDWCPVCHVIMRALKKEESRLSGKNIKVVVISPTETDDDDAFVRELGLPYVVLSDPAHVAAKAFGCFDPAAFGGRGAPLPATFVIDGDGLMRFSSSSEDVTSWLDPRDVLRLLDAAPDTVVGANVA